MALLSLDQSIKLCKKHGFEFPKHYVAKTEAQIKKAAKSIGSTIVLKGISKQETHKTEAGLVVVGVNGEKEAVKAFQEIKENLKKYNKKAKLEGVIVQKMAKGREVIIGGKKDSSFGATVLFGIGGTFVELYKDFSLRICPITLEDAEEMIKEVKAYPYLEEFRGEKAVNFEKLKELIVKASEIMEKEKLKELDINPLIAVKQDFIAVDARVVK